MPSDSRPLTPQARRSANRVLDELQRSPVGNGPAAAGLTGPTPYGSASLPALVEQAKGALMLHYGIDSHHAFAVLAAWARLSRSPVPTIAHTLLRGICEGNPQTEVRQRALIRWLEAQLRGGCPGDDQLRTAPVGGVPAPRTPRSG